MIREIGTWHEDLMRPKRFIYLREITMFQVLIPRDDQLPWQKNFATEGLAREEIQRLTARTGGDWVYLDSSKRP